jgi:trk system potassium uptake protein
MKVVICGAGQVGKGIATNLIKFGNEVVIIDQDSLIVDEINNNLDAKAVYGHASYPSILRQAGIDDADAIIAVTYSDEVNMLACQIAHSLFNVPLKIARIRTNDYLLPEFVKLFHKEAIPIDVNISPELAIADVITNYIFSPGANDILSFCNDSIRIISFIIDKNTPILNIYFEKLNNILTQYKSHLICVVREGEYYEIIDGNIIEGDKIYIAVQKEDLFAIIDVFTHSRDKNKNIIIVGGGRVGHKIAQNLEQSGKYFNIKIIEVDTERAEYIADYLEDSIVLNGNIMDGDIQLESGISNSDIVVAVTNDDKVNILSSVLAKNTGASYAIALVNEHKTYSKLTDNIGIDVIIDPREITVSTILGILNRHNLSSVHSINDDKFEIIECIIKDNSKVINRKIEDLNIEDIATIIAIVRNNKMIIFNKQEILQAQDMILIVCEIDNIDKIRKIFSLKIDYLE